ncbi:hypothetical protein B0O99DRAFT_314672 [Bisporella sp. PMI_857]|nr:hypothetical protein B0O99DRAFT_314672 [Bisporella sp. PMI_857]
MFPVGSSTVVVDVNHSKSRREDMQRQQQRVQDPSRPRIRRRRGACESCKHKKTKCDGKFPCNGCQLYERPCQYVGTANSSNRKDTSGSRNQSSSKNHKSLRTPEQPSPVEGNWNDSKIPIIQRDLTTLEIDPTLSSNDDCQLPASVHSDRFFNGDIQARNDVENRGFVVSELDDCFAFTSASDNTLTSDMNQMEVTRSWESALWGDLLGNDPAVDQTVEFHESDVRHGERALMMEVDDHEMVRTASMSGCNATAPDQIADLKGGPILTTINSNLHVTINPHPVSINASEDENFTTSTSMLLTTSTSSNNPISMLNAGLSTMDIHNRSPIDGDDEKIDIGNLLKGSTPKASNFHSLLYTCIWTLISFLLLPHNQPGLRSTPIGLMMTSNGCSIDFAPRL